MSKYNYLRQQRDIILPNNPLGFKATLSLSIDPALKDSIAKSAKEHGYSLSTLCNKILQEWLEEKE